MGTHILDSTSSVAEQSPAAKRLWIFSYWFPPVNEVGSSRAVAMARYFTARGWQVTVIAGASEAVPQTFVTDLSGFDVHYVPDSWLTRSSSFKPGRGSIAHRLSTALRLLSWPDHIRPVAQAMKRRARDLLSNLPAPDVVLSTALPFSVHAAARDTARQCGALFVADNRDIWARNPYKLTAPFYQSLDSSYERQMLALADLVVAVSEGMSDYYRATYPALADKVLTVMNGVDAGIEDCDRYRRDPARLRLVYTGILYGERRDVTPLLRAAQRLGSPVGIDFYGSEPEIVAQLAADFPGIDIVDRGRVPRAQALNAQCHADALILVVGTAPWEDTLLPGKLFEYIGSGRPIIALANPGSDSGKVIAGYELGIATTQEDAIADFLARLAADGMASKTAVPAALERAHQLRILEERLEAMRFS
ncbi:glycosyltransferase [Sphingopyxis macrogoltabida]|uniref:Glycosyltransferase subfamily 4-like N-terminal domain-containing protein n=1 Tax=Sphingopyxis macrogoltabida TaxID=33050 RepID=A0A0N9V358_SPHMC|nr:glycosyltransferase [Sphingopyxis macrogoltabida]ALH82320.1 hypothetical protein AN936_18780 [Sphingopyxis macrogoltabida]